MGIGLVTLLSVLLLTSSDLDAKGPREQLPGKREKLVAKQDARGLLRLAKWCRKKGLFDEEKETVKLALAADSGLASAQKRLKEIEAKEAHHSHYDTPWTLEGGLCVVRTNTREARLHFYTRAFAAFYNQFQKTFTIKKTPMRAWGRKISVRIFARREDFERYQAEGGGSTGESDVGFYDPNRKELILYEDPKRISDTVDTLYHEGTHLLIDLSQSTTTGKDLPLWLEEGLAEYFGPSLYHPDANEIEAGRPSPNRLWHARSLVEKKKAPRLATLLATADYDGFGVDSYAIAWAFVHMMIAKADPETKKPIHRKAFVKCYTAIAGGTDSTKAVRDAFGDLEPLEQELHEYIRTGFPKEK